MVGLRMAQVRWHGVGEGRAQDGACEMVRAGDGVGEIGRVGEGRA